MPRLISLHYYNYYMIAVVWYTGMTSAQNEFQASHEGEVKKLHSEKKAIQRDLSSTKTKVKKLEEEKNKLQTEVYMLIYSYGWHMVSAHLLFMNVIG